jgi:hypothetical protein
MDRYPVSKPVKQGSIANVCLPARAQAAKAEARLPLLRMAAMRDRVRETGRHRLLGAG